VIPLIVVENPKRWPFALDEAEVVSAREYLTGERYPDLRGAAVYNLCSRYGYQALGYYVSLLAQARGHRPLPSVNTLQSLRDSPTLRIVSEDIDERIQKTLRPLRSATFDLSIYFGRNVTSRYDRLARALFNQFPAPFLRARFVRDAEGHWALHALRPVPTSEVPEAHRPFVLEQAARYFRRPTGPQPIRTHRYGLAILWRRAGAEAPSNERAIRKFVRAASEVGIRAEVIEPDEAGRIAEYDALFLRETTSVDHFTYRLARRATQEGLVVVDDPESIVRCSNKVYQAELFRRHRIPAPRTLVVHQGNERSISEAVGFPCVLKRPDGAFSRGVVKVENEEELLGLLPGLFAESELVVAQEWMPSAFDWRIGLLEGRPLFACRYHMARGHWQIVKESGSGRRSFGRVEALAPEDVPPAVVAAAVRAASFIGDGLYGVDVKEVEGKPRVMEVNDNPNVDAGGEDGVLGDELYLAIMRHFRTKLDQRGGAEAPE
jgi:glutathione synthase/RimK-type ligase-like ATP-grasp enzyme